MSPSANLDTEGYPNGTTDIPLNRATKIQRDDNEKKANAQWTTPCMKHANGEAHAENGAEINGADNRGTQLESNTMRTSLNPQINFDNKAWDREITISLPELDLGDSQAFLLLSWALLVYRSTEKNGEAQFTFNDTTVSISDVIWEDGERIIEVLQRVKELLGKNGSGENNHRMELSNVAITAEYSPEFQLIVSTQILDSKLSVKPSQALAEFSRSRAAANVLTFLDIFQTTLSRQDQFVSQAIQISERERKELWAWNATVPQAIDTCMHDIISERAILDSNRPAVTSWDGTFSYGEVEQLSTRLAYQLRDAGVVLGNTVPLCFEKCRWTVVALLAVMKAGATFLLTDPHQPEGRLQTIVEEVKAGLVVTSSKQAELASRFAPGAKVITVGNELLNTLKELPSQKLEKVPGSAGLYTIFTSGSTGKPKGILLTHANYTSGALPRAALVGYRAHSRVLDFASYAFDVSIDCMLCTLAQGGCICVPSDEQRVNDLSGAITSMNVNMAHMTPSVARVLEADGDVMQTLEVLGLGGELVTAGDAASFGQKTKVVIAYGPSECTVGCTINNDVTVEKIYTTIGKGVGGLTWIVDPENHDVLTHLGGVGELLIEGPIVGLGYLNQPEKTAEVFIEDPAWLTTGLAETPGRHGRLYKTGDLVKYDPNGSGRIVFVGRKDRQVKLRGQRVELGEIEHNLRQRLPSKVSLAVEVITPGGGADTLVAFVAEQSDRGSTADTKVVSFSSELQQALKGLEKSLSSVLPVYMIPTAYIPLKEMPLLVSCKTDRKRLRDVGTTMSQKQLATYRVQAEVEKQKPSSELELKINQLWTKLLGIDNDFSTTDNFFAIGGDSLKAMRLVADARTNGLSLTVADVFAHPTLAGMAKSAKAISADEKNEVLPFSLLGSWDAKVAKLEAAELCNLEVSSIEDIYPSSPLQEGLLALSAKVTEAYIAQRVVELPDIETAERLRSAFDVVTADAPILRTRVVQVPSHGLMQVVVKGGVKWNARDDLEDYLEQDRNLPMDLGDALVRFGSVDTDRKTGKTHLILTIHHALYDGWSMPRVIDRVNKAYAGLDLGAPTSFGAFIKYLAGTDGSSSADFWRQRLDGAGGAQFPPLPEPGYQQKADSLLEHYVELPALSTGMTLATAIRGAWAIVAAQYMGSNDAVFGETLTGRNAPISGVESIEGPMITTVPVRITINQNSTVGEYLQGIHDQTVLRIPHEHMGLQHIRRLSPDARESCELRTGLVLHPNTEEDEIMSPSPDKPANGFVPAGDEDAAREALKFNSYGLMLVISLDPKGFLIMASFDKAMAEMSQMERVLEQLGRTVQQLCDDPNRLVKDVEVLNKKDVDELKRLSVLGAQSTANLEDKELSETYQDIKGTWIMNPLNSNQLLPLGAIGELFVESGNISSKAIEKAPQWFALGSDRREIFPTGQLARYASDGSVIHLGPKEAISQTKEVTKHLKESTNVELTAQQQILQRLWARVLNIDVAEISHNDSFFDLGGDSISAMKLVAEARMEGFKLNVGLIFQHRKFIDMEKILENSKPSLAVVETHKPLSALDVPDTEKFVHGIHDTLSDPTWTIMDILPARPLQAVAVQGTVNIPRFSARYELFYLDAEIDKKLLYKACQDLVARNEMLRTVFVEEAGRCYAVVLKDIQVPILDYETEDDLESFSKKLCDLDCQASMPLGSSFVKFMHVQAPDGRSCLLFRISHAQYDEICLPGMLRQLSQLYENKPVEESVPFSSFVYHVLLENLPKATTYWRDLLKGSSLSVLRPTTPVTNHNHAAVCRSFDISGRSKATTIASIPTAAWALSLARRLSSRDVTFGEVVSGRNIDFPSAASVIGPCWQYLPTRIVFQPHWTALDLLEFIQKQHISSSAYEGIGLSEIIENCTDWNQRTSMSQTNNPNFASVVDWFDSVVHQDVEHVEHLQFVGANSRMETVYPHMEPLREWKFQAFVEDGGRKLTFEIVTFESWRKEAEGLLADLEDVMRVLVDVPGEKLFM